MKGSIRFWASPWTPPTWMKQGPFSAGNVVSPFDGGTMKSDDATMRAFADYLIAFVQAYAQLGINVEVISPQNEPGYTGNYPTCGWSPANYTTFVGQYLGPAIATAGLATKIMLGTFNGGDGDTTMVGNLMGDASARSYIRVLGYQWGMWRNIPRAKEYGLPIWQTEHQCGNYPWATPFDASMAPNDQAYAVESWGLVRDWIKRGHHRLQRVEHGAGHDRRQHRHDARLAAERPSDRRSRDEHAERHADLLCLPTPLTVRRPGRQGRRDQRR